MIRVNRDEPWRDEQVGIGLSSRDGEPFPAITSQAICQEMRGMQTTFEEPDSRSRRRPIRKDTRLRQQLDDMEDTKTWNKQRRPEADASELRVVRAHSKPAPDAEDRLRRLFTLLLEHAARERQAAPEKDSLPDADLAGAHIEAET